ncbi:MAG: YqaE/Pmp3 family membrane protein [Myxococcales bacterium]|nr:YqaE/Pmp3 family membrane protein [Myxococcales bacterium]
MANEGTRDFWRLIIAFFLPPVGVLMQEGASVNFVINLVLTILLFWVGGQVHAAYIITTKNTDGSEAADGMKKFVSVLLSFYIPPVGVAITRGVNGTLVLNALLSLLCVLPGTLHAMWVISHHEA